MGYVKRLLDGYWDLAKNRKRDPATGKEKVSPVPMAPPIGWFKQPSMFDQVRDMVRSEHLRMYAEAQGAETFDEASDFSVDDDIFPASQYEDEFEPLADLQARRQREFTEQFMADYTERKMKRDKARWEREDKAAKPESAVGGTPAPSPAPTAGGQGS